MSLKKSYQYLGLAIIMVFSFYYTEKISSLVLNKNPLMMQINELADDYQVEAVSAIINGDYIIPGMNGLQVNKKESFYKMQEKEVFNQYFLVFDQIKPKVSLEDNKDKLIKQGNAKSNKVSLILESRGTISDYLQSQNIKASLLVTLDTYQKDDYFENINNETKGFKSLENSLNLRKENKHICVVNKNNLESCKKNKNYLIEPVLKLNKNNLIEIKNNLKSGSIIYIKDNANLNDVIYLIKEINYKGLQIDYVSELIKEEKTY